MSTRTGNLNRMENLRPTWPALTCQMLSLLRLQRVQLSLELFGLHLLVVDLSLILPLLVLQHSIGRAGPAVVAAIHGIVDGTTDHASHDDVTNRWRRRHNNRDGSDAHPKTDRWRCRHWRGSHDCGPVDHCGVATTGSSRGSRRCTGWCTAHSTRRATNASTRPSGLRLFCWQQGEGESREHCKQSATKAHRRGCLLRLFWSLCIHAHGLLLSMRCSEGRASATWQRADKGKRCTAREQEQ
mmetsp:Transcript_72106/g.168954  ORF Transcript_72106/g.168954 Transcript_72106/m.168954 type:complete len:241 (-) Transcript_72106:64-786(-)